MDFYDLLDQTLRDAVYNLESLDPGSEEYCKQAKAISELSEVKRKFEKDLSDDSFKRSEINSEKEKEDKRKVWDRIKFIFDLSFPFISLGVYVWLFRTGLKFEEEGVVRSMFSRNLFNSMKFK